MGDRSVKALRTSMRLRRPRAWPGRRHCITIHLHRGTASHGIVVTTFEVDDDTGHADERALFSGRPTHSSAALEGCSSNVSLTV